MILHDGMFYLELGVYCSGRMLQAVTAVKLKLNKSLAARLRHGHSTASERTQAHSLGACVVIQT